MTPHLTRRGKATLTSALLWLLCGALLLVLGQTQSGWPLLAVATSLLLVLTVGFLSAVPIGWVIDGALFELELRPPEASGSAALRTGQRFDARLALTNRSGLRLRRLRLSPELATALRALADEPLPEVELAPASRAELAVPLLATRAGRWFVHGFHVRCRDLLNLFEIRDYLASPQPLKVLPDGLLDARRLRLQVGAAALHDRIGVHELSQRGMGTDLRELRDHQHGDPFRNIAWKATARTGRLMVREFDREITLNTYIMVDMSATMRGQTPRGSKLEHARRLAINFARLVLRGNDRCGLVTFDQKVYGHLPPREGPAQLTRLTQHLIGLSCVADEELTEYDEQEVLEVLIRYLLVQERLDFRRRDPRRARPASGAHAFEDVYDVPLLNRWLRRRLPALTRDLDDPTLRVGVVGEPSSSLARQYCQLRGVELPYRSEPRYGTKERGLVEGLETILAESRNPHQILVISDLTGLVDRDQVVRALGLALARRHKVTILAPYTPRYIPSAPVEAPERARDQVLHELFSAAEARERRDVRRALAAVAVPVLEVGPEASIAGLIARTRLFR